MLKITLGIIITLVVIVVCLLLIALFGKKEYTISREIVINKPKKEVFDYIKLVKNSENYSKWVMMDPHSKKEYKGTDGTVGFVYAWDSENKNVGKGEQEIKMLSEGEEIQYDLRFIKPYEGLANAYLSTDSLAANQTKVTWGFKSTMKFPMNIMLVLANIEDVLGKDLQTGLDNLKAVLEKK
jgi:hypothetical protein